MRSFYEVLGLPSTATAEQIKSMYRKLARKYHADANVGDADLVRWSHQMMAELNAAYEVLSDTGKRAEYDSGFTEGAKANSTSDRKEARSDPDATGLFGTSQRYHVANESVAKRLMQRGLEEQLVRPAGNPSVKYEFALRLSNRNALKWLPLGNYTGPELRTRIELLVAHAIVRKNGRKVGTTITSIAAACFVVLAIGINFGGVDGWGGRIFGGLVFGYLLAMMWVWLPLKLMRGTLRLGFKAELGNSPRSWFWQGLIGLALTLFFSIALAEDTRVKSAASPVKASTSDAQSRLDAVNEQILKQLQLRLEREKQRLEQEKRALELADALSELIMERQGGGQDLKSTMGTWSYSSYDREYTFVMEMQFHGAFIWSNVYWLRGQFTVKADGSGWSYTKYDGNITP